MPQHVRADAVDHAAEKKWATREPMQVTEIRRECHELCVSGLAHAGFRYSHALK